MIRRSIVFLLTFALCAAAFADLAPIRAMIDDGLYEQASEALVKQLAANLHMPREDEAEALALLCFSYYRQRRPREILSLIDKNKDIVLLPQFADEFSCWYARALLETGDCEGAENLLEKLLAVEKTTPREPRTRLMALRILAAAEIRSGNLEKARKNFELASEVAADFPSLRIENLCDWAEAELASGNLKECEKLLERRELAKSLDADILRARLKIALGEISAAKGILRSASSEPSAQPYQRAIAQLLIARCAAAENKPAEMLAAADVLRTLNLSKNAKRNISRDFGVLLISNPATIHRGAAVLNATILEDPAAPASRDALFSLVHAWLNVGSNRLAYAESKRFLETYGDTSEESAHVTYAQAAAAAKMGNFSEAATRFQNAERISTNQTFSADCLRAAADSDTSCGSFASAAELYFRAAELYAPKREAQLAARLQAGDALERDGKIKSAAKVFAEISTNDLAIAEEALLHLAELRERANAHSAAIETYSALAERTAEMKLKGAAILGRARVNYRRMDFAAASADFDTLRKDFPLYADEAAYFLTLAFYAQGKDEDAVKIAKSFAADFPESKFLPDASLWLAQHAFNSGDFFAAQHGFLAFVTNNPTHFLADSALLWAGRAAVKNGEESEACAILARFSEYPRSPRVPEARFLQASALASIARLEEALEILDALIKNYPDSENVAAFWMLRGDCLYSAASTKAAETRYAEARDAFLRATAEALNVAQIYEAAYKTGRCFEQMNEPKKAFDEYYLNVILPFREASRSGTMLSNAAKNWFMRASLQAASLLEERGDADKAVTLLEETADSGVPGAEKAREELKRLRGKSWDQYWHE